MKMDKIGQIENKIINIVSCGVDIVFDNKNNKLHICKSDYCDGDYDDLQTAWEEFKQTNQELKEEGFYSIYKENKCPEMWDQEWELVIKINNLE